MDANQSFSRPGTRSEKKRRLHVVTGSSSRFLLRFCIFIDVYSIMMYNVVVFSVFFMGFLDGFYVFVCFPMVVP